MRPRLSTTRQVADDALLRAGGVGGSTVVGGPFNTQLVYVNAGGNDTTGDGTFFRPFLTIARANASITDAVTLTKPYSIQVGPGSYTENVAFKAGVSICGTGLGDVVVFGNLSMDPTTLVNGSEALMTHVVVNGNGTLDFQGTTGNILFDDCILSGFFTATSGFSVSLFATTVDGSFDATDMSGSVTSQFSVFIGNFSYHAVTINGSNWETFGDTFVGGTFTVDGNHGHTTNFSLSNSYVEGLVLDGAGAACAGRVNAFPQIVTQLNAAPPPNLTSFCTWLAYSAGAPGNWAGAAPTTVQEALDRIAAKTPGA